MSKVTLKVEIEESTYKRITSKDRYVAINDVQVYQEWGEFGRAIKNATPITESDDAVSRKAVHDWIERKLYSFIIWTKTDAHEQINALPSVIPKVNAVFIDEEGNEKPIWVEREQGRWIGGICNKCHFDWSLVAPIANVPEYCPRCGAKMIFKSCSTCKHNGELVCATHGCHNKERYEVK